MVLLADKNIPNQENNIAIYESSLFDEHQDNRFALGVFGANDVLNYEKDNNPLVKGYLQFRANMYIDYANILGDEARRHDGTELDEYDKRSVHFVTFEKRLGSVAVVASTRLIIKACENDLLPIELAFDGKLLNPISVGGVEVSRFIINHNESVYQRRIKSKMIMAELAYVMANDFGPVVGMIERRFQRSLSVFGVTTRVMAMPVPIEEGGSNGEGTHITELMAVEILTEPLKERFKEDVNRDKSMDIGDFAYWGELDTNVKAEL